MDARLNERLVWPKDLWDTRFGCIWYNDQEIFRDSQAELDAKAKAFADVGINHVITFSCTHFRWSFMRDWELLTRRLGMIVRACHKQGMYVTEHHSSHLTHNPLTPEEDELFRRGFAAIGCSLDSWPHLRADCDADPVVIDGVPLSKLRQIDGRTGKWVHTGYHGWCLCFNNPHYRCAYLKYLESLYATGIDGIMTDDVAWFGESHSCACEHCRREFRERTGYDLPQAGEAWNAWHGNTEDPSYRAWQDFRYRAIERFHEAVKDHYEALGLRLLRPNYVSQAFFPHTSAYALEAVPHLDWVFTECCPVIRYSWPIWAAESTHRFAVGRRRGIPAMSLMYPDRPDTERFCWALSMSWGVMYLGTSEGKSLLELERERPLRDFERRHSRLLRRAQKFARLGFYDSRRTRELRPAPYFATALAWLQACYLRNLPIDLFQQEELARLDRYAVVVVNNVELLSEEEIRAFHAFAQNGGILVWAGASGTRDLDGSRRPTGDLAKAFGLPGFEPLAEGAPPQEASLGRGRLLRLPDGFGPSEERHEFWLDREQRVPFQTISQADLDAGAKVVSLLGDLLPGGPDIVAENLPDGVMLTGFLSDDSNSLVLHLVNASDTLEPAGDDVGHADPIPFPSHAGRPTVSIRVRKPSAVADLRAGAARWHDLHSQEPRTLSVEDQDGVVRVQVDPGLLGDYGLVEIALRS